MKNNMIYMSKIGDYIIQHNIDTTHSDNAPSGWTNYDEFVDSNLKEYVNELSTYYGDEDE